jgi:hypothetical protein
MKLCEEEHTKQCKENSHKLMGKGKQANVHMSQYRLHRNMLVLGVPLDKMVINSCP